MDAFDALQLPFMQRATLEIALLAPLAGVLGAQIVLRHLAFYTHGVGTATFPGLVVAGAAGISPLLCAAAVALGFAVGLDRLSRRARLAFDAATALLLVAMLALGVVLASDVFDSGARVDQLLFGSLLAVGNDELIATAIVLALAAAAVARFRRTWLAGGFESASSRALGLPVGVADWVLVALIAVAVVAALDAIGALLVGAILVIPSATARLFATSIRGLEIGGASIALVEGFAGLLIAYELDVPPGATIATLGGVVFALAALWTRAVPRSAAEARA
jgi:ABC-type Mn2+/Zn2+ transport system permease subunit